MHTDIKTPESVSIKASNHYKFLINLTYKEDYVIKVNLCEAGWQKEIDKKSY